MEIQLDCQQGLFFIDMELESCFPFSWGPLTIIFPFCLFLSVFLFLLFLRGINKWAQGSNGNSGSKAITATTIIT